MKKFIPIVLIALASHMISGQDLNPSSNELYPDYQKFYESFKDPSDDSKPWVYWYWINNHVSKAGITKDLESMSKLGIGAAFIGNIFLEELESPKKGKALRQYEVQMLSEQWLELTKHAIKEAGRLGVDIGLFNSPGWSQSGGPWNTPENSMRYLKTFEKNISNYNGGNIKLEKPEEYFETVSVLAIPKRIDSEPKRRPKVTGAKNLIVPKNSFDTDMETVALFGEEKSASIRIEYEDKVSVRSLKIHPNESTFTATCRLYALEDDAWVLKREFLFDRSNDMNVLGFFDYPPVAITFPEIKTNILKLEFENISKIGEKPIGFSEIELMSTPLLESYYEKSLAKMHQTPLPLDDAYKWAEQPEPNNENLVLDLNNVLDITDKLDKEGILHWKAPKGDWTILHMGMASTGVTNNPAADKAKGLEVDKMNKEKLQHHFDAFIGRILNSLPREDRKAFKYVVADSYETGAQNWTDGFGESFQEQFGYDPIPWLPVLSGRIVNSAEESNRFLWDLRRLVADKIAYEYVGGLREICEQNNLTLWLENYGHWGYPSEFLMYGGQSHLIGGEFWSEGDLGSIEVRAAASAAHIYGKKTVSVESYTSAFKYFERHPGSIKKRGDWSFTEGANHPVLHVYVHQPYEDKFPGMNAWFGVEFNRKNTWFDHSKPWIDYQRRCQFMLQQGLYVADIAYFIGEDAPKMTGVTEPSVPEGYSFDYINAEVLLNHTEVKDGRFVLPDGMSYKILVLPKSIQMRPEVLEKLKELVADGGTIVGNAPIESPSLSQYPEADKKIKALAEELWPDTFVNGKKHFRNFGEGRVYGYGELDVILKSLDCLPDLTFDDTTSVSWIHRRIGDSHVYFLSNQSDEKIDFNASFRIEGLNPEFWDPVSGNHQSLEHFRQNGAHTELPLKLFPQQSGFLVFTKPIEESAKTFKNKRNLLDPVVVKEIDNGWEVDFINEDIDINESIRMKALKSWTELDSHTLKHFSGTATYKTVFTMDSLSIDKEYFIDIGNAGVFANIKLNGNFVGGLWTFPWRVRVTDVLKEGKNTLEIGVTNLWVNQLIADSALPEEDKKTWTFVDEIVKDKNVLLPSGLLGPVKITVSELGHY